MAEVVVKAAEGGVYTVSGQLTLDTVARAADQELVTFSKSGDSCTIDLSGVNHADSSGLALLITWAREADKNQCKLQFRGLSGKLLSLAKVTGVDRVLNLQLSSE